MVSRPMSLIISLLLFLNPEHSSIYKIHKGKYKDEEIGSCLSRLEVTPLS